MHRAAKNRQAMRVGSSENLCADGARSAGSKLIDGAVLKKDQRFASFGAVKNNRFMMYTTIQIGLEISSHGSVDGAWQQAEDHAIRMMNPAPRQIKATTDRHGFERLLDRLDHFADRDDLIDRSIFEVEHFVQPL